MSELPRGWALIKVREAGRVQLGRQRSPEFHQGENMRPYLRVANVFEDELRLDDVMEMHFDDADVARYELHPGDILLNEGQSRELVGRPAMYHGELPGACFTNSLIRFQVAEFVEAQFALHLFRHWMRDGSFQKNAQVTTNIAHLGAGRFAEMDFPLPPLAEQRRIVAKLEDLLARSRRAKAALDAIPPLLDKLRQSVLAAAFRGDLTADWRDKNPDVEPAEELLVRIRVERRKKWEEAELARMKAKGKVPGDDRWKAKYVEPEPVDTSELPELPEGWCWTTFETVGDVDLGRQRAPQYLTGRFSRPYLRVANIKDDRIDFEDVQSMDFDPEEFEHYQLRPGDILLSEGQSPELVGQSAIYRGGVSELCFQKTLHRLRMGPASPSPEFAQLVCRHYVRSGVFRAASSLTVNIAHLTLVRLKPLKFPLPPVQEQQEVVRRATAALARVEVLAQRVQDLRAREDLLRRSVLAKAFRGELVPQDPSDEPAETMLARLQAQTTPAPRPARRARKTVAQ